VVWIVIFELKCKQPALAGCFVGGALTGSAAGRGTCAPKSYQHTEDLHPLSPSGFARALIESIVTSLVRADLPALLPRQLRPQPFDLPTCV